MTSVHGYYEIFDYSAFTNPQTVYPPCVQQRTYPKGTTMAIVQERHPKLTFLLRTAGLDWQLADLQTRMTLFLPPEHSMDEEWVKRLDKNAARRFIKYHLAMGFLPEQVLRTSPVYQMRSTLKGHDIYVETNPYGQLFLNTVPIVQFNHFTQNGVIHYLASSLAVPNEFGCCL